MHRPSFTPQLPSFASLTVPRLPLLLCTQVDSTQLCSMLSLSSPTLHQAFTTATLTSHAARQARPPANSTAPPSRLCYAHPQTLADTALARKHSTGVCKRPTLPHQHAQGPQCGPSHAASFHCPSFCTPTAKLSAQPFCRICLLARDPLPASRPQAHGPGLSRACDKHDVHSRAEESRAEQRKEQGKGRVNHGRNVMPHDRRVQPLAGRHHGQPTWEGSDGAAG